VERPDPISLPFIDDLPSSEIRFSGVNAPGGEFSNFYRAPMMIDGKVWPTVEHWVQAQKFPGQALEEEIRLTSTPTQAKRLGSTRAVPLRSDWEKVKDEIMRRGLEAKFTQHLKLRQRLLSTGTAVLVDHTSRDRYWGDGGDGTGKNRLGQLLMEIRDRMRQ
jgi:ribA/ribD-fused uncharacterized protein